MQTHNREEVFIELYQVKLNTITKHIMAGGGGVCVCVFVCVCEREREREQCAQIHIILPTTVIYIVCHYTYSMYYCQ